MNVDAYLRRIGLNERPPATSAGLTAVHHAHLLAIPYENIDVQLHRPVTIERPAIYEKIVERGRGGWCYEMNGILGWALGELGFNVTRATGSVMREVSGDASNGNHLVLRVELPEGLYLADVGFGDGPRDPIKIAAGAFRSSGFDFSLRRVDDRWWRLNNDPRGGAPSFDFNLDLADESVLADKCAFLQTAPISPFVQNLVVQRHVPHGLEILRGRTLRTVRADGISERVIANADELVATLKTVFALDIPDVATLWPKIVARHEEVMAQKANA
ncbi:MAG TPA: arylamine N-acetyltransferase [Rhizomicrobium sp.]|jgi:N-hydroxyarylamine O-acetyltransferase